MEFALKSGSTRDIISNYYNDIILDEKTKFKKDNKVMALQLTR